MLGVFLLLALNLLGLECQDLLSPCDGMHVCPDETSVYTLTQKSWGRGGGGGGGDQDRTHVNSKGTIPSTGGKKQSQGRIEPAKLHQAGQGIQHTTS